MDSRGRRVLHVLMVHFNTPELTARLIKDFPRQTPRGLPIYIHVLDNYSSLENIETLLLKVVDVDHVNIRRSQVNLGFGEGINLLARDGSIDDADPLWILNPDTHLQAGCLEALENELQAGVFAVISPLIFSGGVNDPWIWYCGGSISARTMRAQHHLHGCELARAPSQSFETTFITGAAPMMFASTFRAVGGFPPGYFLYWEDAYFSWRARNLGFKLGVVPSAHLWHAVRASSGSGRSATYFYWYTRNRVRFAKDTQTRLRQIIFGAGALETVRPVATALMEREGRFRKALAALRGTLKGFSQIAEETTAVPSRAQVRTHREPRGHPNSSGPAAPPNRVSPIADTFAGD